MSFSRIDIKLFEENFNIEFNHSIRSENNWDLEKSRYYKTISFDNSINGYRKNLR